MTGSAPAGWYTDPGGSGKSRYWTGTVWHPVVKHEMSRAAKIGLSVGAVIAGLVVIGVLNGIYGHDRTYSPEEYRSGVIGTCQDSVRETLKDPDSARFDGWIATELAAGSQGQKHFTASGMVNAKNGFGGYAGNQPYQCTATVTREGTISASAGPG